MSAKPSQVTEGSVRHHDTATLETLKADPLNFILVRRSFVRSYSFVVRQRGAWISLLVWKTGWIRKGGRF
jgi:hypothetical protein